MKSTCCSGISPRCMGTVETRAQHYDQHNRILIPGGWNILTGKERIYGYMCPECVKAHAPGAERTTPPCARCEEHSQDALEADLR